MACPDIYLNLENNESSGSEMHSQKSGGSPSRQQSQYSSSRKTENAGQRKFTNAALDDPFIAPEILFGKF